MAERPASEESAWHVAGCLALLLVGLQIAAAPVAHLAEWHIDEGLNPGVAEAVAWRHGRVDVPPETRSTVPFEGKRYNIHPPYFTLLSLGALALGSLQGVPAGVFYPPWYVGLVALPLPLAAFWAFHQVVRRAAWAAALAGCAVLGTALLPMLNLSRNGPINEMEHITAATGLFLIAGDVLGGRRVWPAIVGLFIAAWSRSTTIFLALPIVWMAWQAHPHRARRVAGAAIAAAAAVGGLLAMNWLRFGHPLHTGYLHLYDDWDPGNWHVQRFRAHGLMSVWFVPENLRYLFLEPPRFRISAEYLQADNGPLGVAIWWTTPLLLFVPFEIGRIWRDGGRRVLLIATLGVIAAVAAYHSPGVPQVGFYRYALDFVPVWLVLIAEQAVASERRRGIFLACFAWSAFYFHMVT